MIVHLIFLVLLCGSCSSWLQTSFARNKLELINQGKKIIAISSVFLIFQGSADAAPAKVYDFNDINRLVRGLKEIDYLLDHWDEKTTYCNFGEFQRDLLKTENKEKLFKAAAETGLLDYDKSATMNIVCRKDPQVVRAFLGLTDDNTVLNKADKLMKSPAALEIVPPDHFEDYIEAVDSFSQAVATADSLAYQARTDFSSTETNTRKKILEDENGQGYLAQSKKSVIKARNSLALIVKELNLSVQ